MFKRLYFLKQRNPNLLPAPPSLEIWRQGTSRCWHNFQNTRATFPNYMPNHQNAVIEQFSPKSNLKRGLKMVSREWLRLAYRSSVSYGRLKAGFTLERCTHQGVSRKKHGGSETKRSIRQALSAWHFTEGMGSGLASRGLPAFILLPDSGSDA